MPQVLKPPPEQVNAVQELLNHIKRARAGGKHKDVKTFRQKAVALAKKTYHIADEHTKGEPAYDPKSTDNGNADESGGKVEVTLGKKTFSSPGWLASTELHEMVAHGDQAAQGRWYVDAQGSALNEVEAYDLELANAAATGLTNAEIAKLQEARKEEYDTLSTANKKQADRGDYRLANQVNKDDSVPDDKPKHNVSLYRALHHLNKGGLHRALNVPEGEKIPANKLEAAKNSSNEHVRHMANFAGVMGNFNK
jgi:hypothetical protein